MGIKVKARQTKLTVGPSAGQYRFIMQAEIYSTLKQEKVISEASIRSGIPKGSLNASWQAIGDVVKAWATEGHSVAVPGLGTMRFGLQAGAVTKVEDVSAGLITTRKVIFTPQYQHQAGTEGYLRQHYLLRQGRKRHQTGVFLRSGQCG